ncbi:hypothetical protein J5N97_001051 [Dioscorea zingiberensis]|uniref:Transmembrane protein n=1 Tax=Dioscorea zingiberensis TaxID=325984 RepID=A0A9D5BUI7_9LILI|nr:hypothetical protein J5N97_001051 [Dioscorea zingiberensis]
MASKIIIIIFSILSLLFTTPLIYAASSATIDPDPLDPKLPQVGDRHILCGHPPGGCRRGCPPKKDDHV